MALSRYQFTKRITVGNKTIIGTNRTSKKIYKAVLTGNLPVTNYTLKEGERLDTLSFQAYGNGSYWWVLAAASGIGWPMQVPPGTIISLPKSLDAVIKFL